MKIPLILSVILFFFVPIFSTTWTVDDDGTAQYVKIQEAIDAASDGDTIFVYSGIYLENIDLYLKKIFLIGNNKDNTIIRTDNGNTLYTDGMTYISGFTFDGNFESDIGIQITSNTIVENNIIKNYSYCGIKKPFGPSFPNSNIIIKNNKITDNHFGIFFEVDYPGHPDSIKVIGNTIKNNEYGITYFPMQICCGPPFDTTWNVNADSNYWGYNNADSIAESIWDKNDSEKAIAQLNYEYWYSDSIENQSGNILTGIHYNNIYDNFLYNVYAFNDQGSVIDETPILKPNNFRLFQNYPNPFNGQTTIDFQIGKTGYWSLDIYNTAGQKIGTVFKNRKYTPGQYQVKWNTDLNSGIFYVRLSDGCLNNTIKAIHIK